MCGVTADTCVVIQLVHVCGDTAGTCVVISSLLSSQEREALVKERDRLKVGSRLRGSNVR